MLGGGERKGSIQEGKLVLVSRIDWPRAWRRGLSVQICVPVLGPIDETSFSRRSPSRLWARYLRIAWWKSSGSVP